MDVTTRLARPEERALIEGLFQFYIYDFSELYSHEPGDWRVDAVGRFGAYPHIERYWTDADREPLLIEADGRTAGFALINRFSHRGATIDHAVGEFFVLRLYRRFGVGHRAARAIFTGRPGRWELAIAAPNAAARSFWPRAVLATPGVRDFTAVKIAEMSRDLIEAGLPWSWTPARVQHFITGADSSVVVVRNQRRGDPRYGDVRSGVRRGIEGFAIMHFGDEVAHLNLLAVAPENRRQGLGSQLMQWLTATAIEAGILRIDLELRTHNDQARAFYERLEFVQQEVVQGYYQGREAALRMSRRLAKNQC